MNWVIAVIVPPERPQNMITPVPVVVAFWLSSAAVAEVPRSVHTTVPSVTVPPQVRHGVRGGSQARPPPRPVSAGAAAGRPRRLRGAGRPGGGALVQVPVGRDRDEIGRASCRERV